MASSNALELSIKIAGKVDNSFTAAVSKAQKQTSSLAKAISSIGKAGLAIEGAALTGTVAALKKCTDYAQEFEVSMADVAKYVNGLTDSSGKVSDAIWEKSAGGNGKSYKENYDEMQTELFKLSTQFAITPEELATMASNMGQSGYDFKEIASMDENGNVSGVLLDTATMAAAFDIDTGTAGEYMAKWEEAFSASHDEVMTLNEQINYLGNNSATTAAEIAEAVNGAGSLGLIANVSTGTTAALADAMLSAGGDAATVSTSLKRIYTNIMKGSSATDAQQGAWAKLDTTAEEMASRMVSEDTSKVLYDVFEKIGTLAEEEQTSVISTLFGQWAIGDVARVVNGIKNEGTDSMLYKALDMVSITGYDENGNATGAFTGSMAAEAATKNSTAAATQQMKENARSWMMNEIGEQILPATSKFNEAMIKIYTALAENAPQIGEVATSFGDMLVSFANALGETLPKVLPDLQEALNWIAANPTKALARLGAVTGTFATMAAAPKIESAANLLFGSGGTTGESKGILGTLFSGGQSAAKTLTSAPGGILSGIGSWWTASKGLANDTTGKSGFFSTLGVGLKALAPSGLLNYGNSVSSSISALGNTKISQGVAGLAGKAGGLISTPFKALGGLVANSKAGQAIGLVGKSVGQGFGQFGSLMGMAGSVVANSAPVKAVGGGIGAVGQFLGAGGNVLGTVLSPLASVGGSFLSLFSGIAPVITIIGTLIGLFVVFQNHMGDIQGLISETFGPQALIAFNAFYLKVQNVLSGIGNFINGGWLDAFNNAKNFITQTFGADVGNAFGALQPALEAVFSFVQQVVAFGQNTVAPIIEQIAGFVMGTLAPGLLQLFTTCAPALGTIGNLLGGLIMTGMNALGQVFKNIILPVLGTIIEVILNFCNAVAPVAVSVIESIVDTVTTVVNGIISAINWIIEKIDTLSFDIPEWVPLVGGKHIGFDFTPLPLLANGGFTTGPSIAGEAGTEAVISFKSSERAANLATWAKAGQMLGARGADIRQLDDNASGQRNTNTGEIKFAPVFQFYGDVTKEKAVEAGQISFAEFKRLYNQLKREEARTAF